ncbi:thioesterase II family protein [Micromonospora sp. KLBMP9576]|uniref:thioesterase II family protein n=1 Tax=Micromonospora sp. KLBMP9576 TaxID=3424769 RepID=UPI003D8EC3CF
MPGKAQRRNPWLPHPPSATATGRIFLIPYSGCGASMYRRWPRRIDGVEFLPIELPGHERRFAEPHFGTYQALARELARGLAPHLDVPFAFFGHCASALAAYEVSAELVRSGLPHPTNLYVSSQIAPQDGPGGRFLTMDDAALGAELSRLVTAMGGVPDPELIELHLEVMRADVDANKRYVLPDPPRLPGPITVIGWSDDVDIPAPTMAGWSVCGDTTSVLLPGDHHRFTEGPTELLDLLRAGVAGRAPAGARKP